MTIAGNESFNLVKDEEYVSGWKAIIFFARVITLSTPMALLPIKRKGGETDTKVT